MVDIVKIRDDIDTDIQSVTKQWGWLALIEMFISRIKYILSEPNSTATRVGSDMIMGRNPSAV